MNEDDRNENGVKKERTGKRDLTYNEHHRNFNRRCYYVDVDGMEYRFFNNKLTLIAIIEVKISSRPLSTYTENQKKKFIESVINSLNYQINKLISVKFEIPSFIINVEKGFPNKPYYIYDDDKDYFGMISSKDWQEIVEADFDLKLRKEKYFKRQEEEFENLNQYD